jgi:hypothetical protein
LWNAARAWHRAGENARAANLYAQYLREAPPGAPDRNSATTALRTLSAKLGKLEIHAPGVDDVRVDGRPIDASGVVYVNPGRHVVTGRRGGDALERSESTPAGSVVSVAFDAASSAAPATPSPSPPPSPAPTAAPAPRAAAPPSADASTNERPSSGWSPTIVWIGGAITVAAGAVTIWSGLDTLAQRRSFYDEPSQEKLDDGRDKQTRTNILLGATIGVGVLTAAAAIFLVDWKGRPKNVEVGVGPGSILVTNTF